MSESGPVDIGNSPEDNLNSDHQAKCAYRNSAHRKQMRADIRIGCREHGGCSSQVNLQRQRQ
jgi:hypothetical protein